MPTASSPNPVASIPCFSGLDPSALKSIHARLQERPYDRGEMIFVEGERCPGLFIVKSGAVKLYRSSPEGEEHIVRVLRSGGCFECAPLFDRGPNPVSAEALERTELYLLPAEAFDSLLRDYPEVSLEFVSVLALRLRSLLNTVEDLSFRPVYARLARLLSQLAEPQGEVMVVSPFQRLSQQHLACMLGCTRQVLNASLRRLVKEGIIGGEKRRIVVLKPEALKKIAGDG